MSDDFGSNFYKPKPFNHSRGHAFLSTGGDIFYSPNCSRRVNVPVPTSGYPFRVREANFEKFLLPRWWTKPYHYLSFIPLRPSFDSIVFDCLRDIMPYVEPVEGGRYALAARRVNQWVQIEDALILIAHLLTQCYTTGVRAALNPIPPSLLGFKKSFYTLRAARLHAAASRDWFLVWTSLISSKIADIETQTNRLGQGDWFTILVNANIPQDWLSAIQSSIICDFSPQCPRVGTFLDIHNPDPSQPSVEWFYSWNIPVWYRPGRGHPKLAHLQPPPQLLQAATTFISKDPSRLPPTSPPSSPLSEYSPREYERAQKAYLAKKPWDAFFALHEEHNKKILLKETPDECRTRLNRERNPPRTSADVFIWEWSEDEHIELLRRRVGRKEREDILDRHSDAQCRYDAFRNVWDVCEYFGTDAPDDDDSDDDNNYDDDNYNNDSFHDDLDTEPSIDPDIAQKEHQAFIDERIKQVGCNTPLHYAMNVARSSGIGIGVDLTHTVDELDVLEYLSSYYGFIPPLPIPTTDPVPIDRNDWDECLKSVGLRIGTYNPPRVGLTGPIVNFIRGLQRCGPKEDEWDLLPGNRDPLRRELVLEGFHKLNDNLYLLHHSFLVDEIPCQWQIAVTTSANALHVLRHLLQVAEIPSSAALAQHLAEQGIPFHTLLKLDPLPSSISLDAMKIRIPRRVANYRFGPGDYQSYIAQRKRLLSTPRARAAVLRGGIVGRLAREHLEVDSVTFGPSSAVTDHQLGYSVEASGTTYWDDGLTSDELAVICGLYCCYTGIGDQVAWLSWWPLPESWDHKGNSLNWGHWTEWNESWYQSRLLGIEAGDADCVPLSRNHWRNTKLKVAPVWRKVTSRILQQSNELFSPTA